MKISTRHQELSERLNNLRVLDYPEEFLGPNWKAVLNFWIYLDTLTEEQWKVIHKRFRVMSAVEWVAAVVAIEAATKTTHYWNDVHCYAILEIIGSHELLNKQKPFTFIPLYLNL